MATQLKADKKYYLFPADSISIERVIRKLSFEQGLKKEASGSCRRVFDTATGALRGFQLISPEEARVDLDLPSISTSASILAWEMDLNLGYSRTAGLSEERRLECVANHRLPEDAVERVQAKVRVFAVIGSARGDVLRVWPR